MEFIVMNQISKIEEANLNDGSKEQVEFGRSG